MLCYDTYITEKYLSVLPGCTGTNTKREADAYERRGKKIRWLAVVFAALLFCLTGCFGDASDKEKEKRRIPGEGIWRQK